MSRLQSQKLMESVLEYEDFPILLETWRTCLQDEFDVPHLIEVLDEVTTGEINISEVSTGSPSPLARSAGSISERIYLLAAAATLGRTRRLAPCLAQVFVYAR